MSTNIVFAAAAAAVLLTGIFLLHIIVIYLYRRIVSPVLHTCLELPKFEFSLFALLLVALSYYAAGVLTDWLHGGATTPACIIAIVIFGMLLLPYYTFKCWIAIGPMPANAGINSGIAGPHWHSFQGVIDTRSSSPEQQTAKGLGVQQEAVFSGPHWQLLHHAPTMQGSRAVAEGQESSHHQPTQATLLQWMWPSHHLFAFFGFLFEDTKVCQC
jgi:hypothetical protein